MNEIKPLPAWFFAFEGMLAATYDLLQAWDKAWTVLIPLAALNIALSTTVMRPRLRMMKAVLRDRGTRKIALALVAGRTALHLLLTATGTQVTSPPAHLTLAVLMSATTITMLWLNQRLAFRALTPAK